MESQTHLFINLFRRCARDIQLFFGCFLFRDEDQRDIAETGDEQEIVVTAQEKRFALDLVPPGLGDVDIGVVDLCQQSVGVVYSLVERLPETLDLHVGCRCQVLRRGAYIAVAVVVT